jgi:excisionase family DNA binding protein
VINKDNLRAIDTGEFCYRTGLSPSLVKAKIASRELRSFKVGRRRLIPISELERLMGESDAAVTEAAAK